MDLHVVAYDVVCTVSSKALDEDGSASSQEQDGNGVVELSEGGEDVAEGVVVEVKLEAGLIGQLEEQIRGVEHQHSQS